MSNNQNVLTNTAERLGIQDDSTIKKAKEFLRVFQSKGSVKSLNDIAKTILCLDLASNYSGICFDKDTALKLSGLKKSAYQNSLHTVEKVLELDKPLTISELCVQFNCTAIKDLAEEILDKYKTTYNKIKDLHHPQYVTASVYAACKVKSIKVQKPQFISASHLKPSQWKELTNEFDKFVKSLGIGSPKKRKEDNLNKIVEKLTNDIENKVVIKKKEYEGEEIEEYEVWKKRILDEAYEAIKSEKNLTISLTPVKLT